jgi:P27 family predicted phage terminase small subunit
MPRPRKSDDLHVLHGSTPHDRTPVTPSMLVAGRPKFLKVMSAKRCFKMLCQMLEERRALTAGDGPLLHLAAEIWERRSRAQANLKAEGEVCKYTRLDPNGVAHQIQKANLNLKIAADAERQLVAILDRLGLSPIAGSKVKQTRPDEQAEEAQPGTIGWRILHGKDSQ